jgi:four helix bundle protein
MKDFRDLQVWHKAHELTLQVYRATYEFPKEELYGLVSQLRRACVSIGANIAEGCGRGTAPEFQRFLQIAMGSSCEVECLLLLAHDLCFLDGERHLQLSSKVQEIKRMLAALIRKIRTDHNNS